MENPHLKNNDLPAVIETEQNQHISSFMSGFDGVDCSQVESLVKDEAYLQAEHLFGREISVLKMKRNDCDEDINSLEQRISLMQKQKAKIPKRVQRPITHKNEWSEDNKATWSLPDLSIVFLLLASLIATWGIGFANVYSNIMASGEPVFLNHPTLAVFIALLMPVASIALKSLSICFESPQAKKQFRNSMFFLTVLALLGWSVSFASQFTGVSSEIDFSELGQADNSHGPALLVWLQLISELLVSISLSFVLENFLSKHRDLEWADNPEYYQLSADLSPLASRLEKLKNERQRLHLQLRQACQGYKTVIHSYRKAYAIWLSQKASSILD